METMSENRIEAKIVDKISLLYFWSAAAVHLKNAYKSIKLSIIVSQRYIISLYKVNPVKATALRADNKLLSTVCLALESVALK